MAALLCLAPLLGVVWLGAPVAPYLEFPPTTRYVAHAPFRWPAFMLFLLFAAAVCIPFLYRFITCRCRPGSETARARSFPWWGWSGGVMVLTFWILAWNRFAFFQPLQRYTFFPLWGGYLLVVNGLTWMRKGRCLLYNRPRLFLRLFGASALFWWYFEYLNRFARNWYYLVGEGNLSALEYVIHASICFSTVLPAVCSTDELLSTMPRLAHPFTHWRPVTLPGKKALGWLVLAGATLALAWLVVLPDYLFPLIWIAPLLVIVGSQLACGRSTIFAGVEEGNWQQVVLPALAALLCGWFWEMWNYYSLAHWEYSVPWVDRFRVFHMPLLGYAGYLPFGLECVAVAALLDRDRQMRRAWRSRPPGSMSLVGPVALRRRGRLKQVVPEPDIDHGDQHG